MNSCGYGYGMSAAAWLDWRHHNWSDWTRRAGLKVISTEAGPVIPIEDLRSQCEIVAIDADTDAASGESHPADAQLLRYLSAAIDHAEEFSGLSIAQRTYEMALDCFPWNRAGIELLRPPVIEVVSFLAVGAGSEGELDAGTDFVLDDYRSPPVLLPPSLSTGWPPITRSTNALKIRYRVGYTNETNPDTDAEPMPESVRQALLLMVGHFFENRSDSSEKALTTIPHGFEALLRPKQVRLGMA